MSKILHRFCVFCVVLFFFACSLPVHAEDLLASPLSPLQVNFNYMKMATSLNSHFSMPHLKIQPFAEREKGKLKQVGGGYRWEKGTEDNPDWRGIKFDTVSFLAYQVVVIGVLYLAPEALSGWSQDDKDNYSFEKWTENVTHPVWDEDKWWVNYILHPYWGATYYIRARERGFGRTQSFWYSFILSTLYEYGAEALFEPVSYQDLIVTPVAGSLLGIFVFAPIREKIRSKKGNFDWSDKAVLFITDPLGVVNEEVARIFGLNTEVSFRRVRTGNVTNVSGWGDYTEKKLFPEKSVWGIQLKIKW
jgi:hypothetical protein